MKSELNVKQCTSQIFWWSFLHNLWLGIVGGMILGVLYAALALIFSFESELLETILSIGMGALAWFISIKITTSTIYKNHTLDVSILNKVVKRLWTIYIICSSLVILMQVIFIPISFNASIEKLENTNKILGIYEAEEFQEIIDEAKAELPTKYVITVGTSVSNLLLALIFTKYAAFDLEKKYTKSETNLV